MIRSDPRPTGRLLRLVLILAPCALAGLAVAATVDTWLRDFLLSGTQVGHVGPDVLQPSSSCTMCHASYDVENSPFDTWKGSLMANAARDPLFWAQMTNANQDAANVGYFCMRCHVPNTFATGTAYGVDGTGLGDLDKDGVNCHFCHSMVDPNYVEGVSPAEDVATLANLSSVPQHYGNAMFVLDETGLRRGPYADATSPHPAVYSPFTRSSDQCGTCHDVGNVAITRQPDGTYMYNAIGQRTPDEDPHSQFPLERTYTEWKLSAFANGGVDMGGRFGGEGATVVSTCQDCHMPRATARGAATGPLRSDLARHDFAGASSWVLMAIAHLYQGDPEVDQAALLLGQQKANDMLARAASLKLRASGGELRVRVVNESGHKIPTGHIEGRRIFLNVRFLDASSQLVQEYGHYDQATAHLDEASTRVYEMQVGISETAAAATGLPTGVTTHMSLANTIEKDNRIPPRGFSNAAYEAAGAPVVAASYADGQHWDDAYFPIPAGAQRAKVTLYYQTVTRHYIEALRDGNHTDDWGQKLYRLWLETGKGAPVEMATRTIVFE